MWNNIPGRGGTCNKTCQYTILINNWVHKGTSIDNAWKRVLRHLERYPHDEHKIWRMASTMAEGATISELLEIKNNPLTLLEPKYIVTFNVFDDVKNDPKQFHEHYQNLASMRKEQEQWLAQLNTRLYCHCLIPSDFEYCDDCDFIYNPPLCMIYTISEKIKPISNCTSELESIFNPDSNSDNNNNNNKNTGSSSVQYGNEKNSDSNSNSNYKQYITLFDLTKEQKLKWFSDNNEGIMPEHTHDTDAGFDLRYLGTEAIKLEPHMHTCIDLKIALEILATTMIQLASRSNLAKREINIREGIIDMGYVRNIIAILQNDSEKVYILEPNEKIAQAIFLPLEFRSTDRVDVPVNMAEEEIVDQKKIISMGQTISIPPYDQYMIGIKWEIGFINLYIPAKEYSHIKIPIYNNTENIIVILAGTTIRYLSTEIEDQPPSTILDFPQLCGYVDIISQTIYE
ncbi:hypothetical protein G9A89_006014 [Geosiphon pyriformis]|nr:hypothetical protein G9A89_006014 [Geosiphon pyriformis]